jgi:tripartite-type tricarboxylate transporter receptor subunit TctC
MVTHPLLNSKLPYDPIKDFVPVGRILINVPILTVHPSTNVKTIKELLALAKAKPKMLNYSSSGMGSPNHLAVEMLEDMSGTSMIHVPYKGAAPSVVDLVAGHVQLGINAIPSVAGQIKSGKLVPLGVASAKRSRLLPDVPTIAEAGVPGFEYEIWYALFAPAKTPSAAVAKSSAALQTALRDPAVQAALLEQGAEPAPTTSQELASYMQQDITKWRRLIKERNLQLE